MNSYHMFRQIDKTLEERRKLKRLVPSRDFNLKILCFYDKDLAHCLAKHARDHLWLNKTLPNI